MHPGNPGGLEIKPAPSPEELRSVHNLHLAEDQAFGVHRFAIVDGRLVTRDLLDSVAELNFLERHLAISQRNNSAGK